MVYLSIQLFFIIIRSKLVIDTHTVRKCFEEPSINSKCGLFQTVVHQYTVTTVAHAWKRMVDATSGACVRTVGLDRSAKRWVTFSFLLSSLVFMDRVEL